MAEAGLTNGRLPRLADRRVLVAWSAAAAAGPVDPRWLESLSAQERERAGRMRAEQRQAEFVLGRHLLRSLLAPLLQQRPTAVPVVVGRHGRPELAGAPFFFSIAHSGGHVAVALARGCEAIGLDLEALGRRARPVRPLARVLCLEEQDWLAGLPEDERAQAFLRLWARKEAFGKCTGRGLAESLSSLDARPGCRPPSHPDIGQTAWQDLALAHDLVACLCQPQDWETPELWCWDAANTHGLE